eukprot:UN02945
MASFASSTNHHLEHFHEEEQLEIDLNPIVEEKHVHVHEDNKSIAISEMSQMSHITHESGVDMNNMDFNIHNIDFTLISPRVVMRKKQIERNRMQYKHSKSRSKSLSNVENEIGNDSIMFQRANTYSNHQHSNRRDRNRKRKRKHKHDNTSTVEIRRIKSADYHKKRRRKSSKHKGKHKKHQRSSVKISELEYSQTSPINT